MASTSSSFSMKTEGNRHTNSYTSLYGAPSSNRRSNSSDTQCISNSSCYMQRKRPLNPLTHPLGTSYSKNSSNSVRQRVQSAKLLKFRSMQNQLNNANYHLSELSKENHALKILQIRQEKALSKYESTKADLPRLLHSHDEQLRILTEKNKLQRKTIHELNELLKVRENELAKITDKLNHLEKLNRDKGLLDREKLLDELGDLTFKLQKSDEQVTLLNRKLILESKASKQRQNAEIMKHKQCQKQLEQAMSEIERMTGLLQSKQNVVQQRKHSRFGVSHQQQSISMVTLRQYRHTTNTIDETDSINPTVLQEEPIKHTLTESKHNIMKVKPIEESLTEVKEEKSDSEVSLNNFEKESETESDKDDTSDITARNTDVKQDKCITKIDTAIQRATDNANDEFDEKLADYCSDIMGNVRMCGGRIDAQKNSLAIAKHDTDILMDTFKKTQQLESKLKSSLFNINDNEGDIDFIKEILSEEVKFHLNDDDYKNGQLSKTAPEEGKKFMTTLKSLDGSDNTE